MGPFQIGDIIKCVDNSGFGRHALTEGKTYTATTGFVPGEVGVIGDDGTKWGFRTNRFEMAETKLFKAADDKGLCMFRLYAGRDDDSFDAFDSKEEALKRAETYAQENSEDVIIREIVAIVKANTVTTTTTETITA